MKNIFTVLTVLMFGFATFTQANTTYASGFQDTSHKTKSDKLDTVYKAN